MVEFEADDAIAAAAGPVRRRTRASSGSSSARRTRTWPSSSATTGSCCGTGAATSIYDDAGVREKWGVAPTSIPDWLGLVGDSSDGFPGLPGWGAKSAAAVLLRYGHYEDDPAEGVGLGGARASADRGRWRSRRRLRDHWDEALLYRDLARLRTADDGVPIRQTDADELRWDGAPRAEWEAFCEEWGLDRLALAAASLASGSA